ncbi:MULTISPECIES: hypothetical protein [unclassified Lentimicrobium]|uniref:hypothetical protein n=1 Tax=unclassified Lentimicrobium TaxID=2677434 RepID=UPI0015579039|nr:MULTISPECIES: hypothetical protein [unclassified Lentimicrobium]NPD44117.1 hypothetical protein [Lentimicrobium sp. S6]NPD86674.1 hypothetical protein [Lentimicrobium sp. L6]
MEKDENVLKQENSDELKLFIEKKKNQNEVLKKMMEQLQILKPSNNKNNNKK